MTTSYSTPQLAARNFSKQALDDGFNPQALHEYTDANGNNIYWRIRLRNKDGDKWIRPMYQDPNGQYHLSEPPAFKNQPKPIYGLHLLAKYPNAAVIIVEGEYPADALNRFLELQNAKEAYIAITSGSATSAENADWKPLEGRHCLLWPDNDEPGNQYIKQIFNILKTLNCHLEVVDIKEIDLPNSGDCVDWLKNNPAATIGNISLLPLIKDDQTRFSNNHSTSTDTETVSKLAALSPLEYDRIRVDEANKLGVRPQTLDQMVKAARKTEPDENKASFLDEIEPWPEPINPLELLDEIVNVINRFIICQPETAHAAALWIAMTWFSDVIQVAPLAVITAPEKRCGKSQLLFLMSQIVKRPLMASNITPAALFRSIDAWKPTLLIDEADSFMRENEELRGLLNCGHTRNSAYTIRVVGDEHIPKHFNVFGPKALAGIGHLADTIMDRSITLELRRKLPNEHVDRLRYAEPELFETLTAKLARLANDYAGRIQQARPALPNELNDRAQDNWEPLLAIAEIAGDEWIKKGHAAALKLSNEGEQLKSISIELLTDIQEIFGTKGFDRISSSELIKILCSDEEKPWATYNRGNPIKPRQIATRLKEFGISSNTIRVGITTAKGYMITQFSDVFERYLPTLTPEGETT